MSAFPVILSSPSGGGKTTIARELLSLRTDVGYSVSCTTRPAREGERNGVDYNFFTREQFREAIARHEFAEAAEVHGELYGTLRSEIDRVVGEGRHVVMDIDVQGARQLARSYPESVLVFVLPPSADVLLERLRSRRTEASDSLARRLASAVEELRSVTFYDYVVVNDDLRHAVERVSAIIDAEMVRRVRATALDARVERLVRELQAAAEFNPVK
ncbi:guanylate kinase [soil metagenome]